MDSLSHAPEEPPPPWRSAYHWWLGGGQSSALGCGRLFRPHASLHARRPPQSSCTIASPPQSRHRPGSHRQKSACPCPHTTLAHPCLRSSPFSTSPCQFCLYFLSCKGFP